MVNDTIKKYEIKEKHKIYVKTLWRKNHKQRINFTINLRHIIIISTLNQISSHLDKRVIDSILN